MTRRTVVVEGGGDNVYEVSESDRKYYVYKGQGGLSLMSRRQIGTTSSLDDALALIRSHSGRQIKRIS